MIFSLCVFAVIVAYFLIRLLASEVFPNLVGFAGIGHRRHFTSKPWQKDIKGPIQNFIF